MLLYNTLILPHLNYCILAWANSSEQNIQRLFKLQKRAIRVVSHSAFRAHSMPIFSSLSVLTVHDIYLLQCAIHMFLCHNKLLPESILSHYKLNNATHSYNTRNSDNFHFPSIRTSSFRKSFFFHGHQVWKIYHRLSKTVRH